MSEYPECEKLLAIETDRRMITEFCEWLDANNIFMGRFDDGDRGYYLLYATPLISVAV